MPSEGRLHPLSFLFHISASARTFIVPLVVFFVGAGSAGWSWELSLGFFLIPYGVVEFLRCARFRYRYEPGELVIESGLLFRKERHVPYTRIQNVDAVRSVFHRLLGVAEIRVETGGGDEPEARLRVLPLAALGEMRHKIIAGRHGAEVAAESPIEPPAGATLLRLGIPELMLFGFIESRGIVIVAAASGLMVELGLFDRLLSRLTGATFDNRMVVRQIARAAWNGFDASLYYVGAAVLSLAALLLVMRLLSMFWAVARLHRFILVRDGDDLRAEFGLFTRVSATIPLHRIQSVTIVRGPLHRAFGRASVRVSSAGGQRTGADGQQPGPSREPLAPIISDEALPRLVAELLPGFDPAAVSWQRVDPRGFRRELFVSWVTVLVLTLPFVTLLRWRLLPIVVVLLAWSALASWQAVRHIGWAVDGDAVHVKSGWIWRRVSIARFAKIQAVTFAESPFDRRARMASVRVDTAGARGSSSLVLVPYLSRATAESLHVLLSAAAARTAFRW